MSGKLDERQDHRSSPVCTSSTLAECSRGKKLQDLELVIAPFHGPAQTAKVRGLSRPKRWMVRERRRKEWPAASCQHGCSWVTGLANLRLALEEANTPL